MMGWFAYFLTQSRRVRRDLFLYYMLKLRRGASYDARAQSLRVLAPLGAALRSKTTCFAKNSAALRLCVNVNAQLREKQ